MSLDRQRRQHLAAMVRSFSDSDVWVVGDLMLDDYVVGSVSRISPEAPVQVVKVTDTFFRLGGAANVAHSVAALGGKVHLCGVVGDDDDGTTLLRMSESAGIDASHVHRTAQPTTRKTRVLGPRQQLLRLDREDVSPCADEVWQSLADELAASARPTAVILCDYDKGLLTETSIRRFIEAAGAAPVLVDPKKRDLTWYHGATLLKPNLLELEEAAGRSLKGSSVDELVAVVRPLMDSIGLDSVVLTLSERGMLVVDRGRSEENTHEKSRAQLVPARGRQVYDVTGAGDTTIAVLALALSKGADLIDAANIANVAAGLVVDEVGAVAVDVERLVAELQLAPATKTYPRTSVGEQVLGWKRKGKRVVFTNGCFDLLHVGHLSLLRQAAELGDVLVVGINSDSSVARLKGADRPLVPESERSAMLAALEFVDAVVVFQEDTPLELIRELQPDVLVKGQDYRIDQVVGRETVESYGGVVQLVPLLPQYSTSKLIERIRRTQRMAK